MKNYLSLGAGVQSSTLALMAAQGDIPMPDGAIFADTQAEPAAVYKWLDWLEKQLPYPVYRVSKGSLEKRSLKIGVSKNTGISYLKGDIPAFMLKEDGSQGIMWRKCTSDFKIVPVTRKLRELTDWKRGEKRPLVNLWMGISYDEIQRMKDSREKWINHEFPLIDMEFRRSDCKKWMKDNGYPEPPRSACIFCPFRSNEEWKSLPAEEFDYAVKYERKLHAAFEKQDSLKQKPFLHRQMIPLDEVDLDKRPDARQLDMFLNECDGLCGV